MCQCWEEYCLAATQRYTLEPKSTHQSYVRYVTPSVSATKSAIIGALCIENGDRVQKRVTTILMNW